MTSPSAAQMSGPPAESGGNLQITNKDILDVSKEASADWLKIVRRLPDGGNAGQLAFGLRDPRLVEIKKEPNDEERLTLALDRWRSMHRSHTWGMLQDTLVECGYGRLVDDILCKRLSEAPEAVAAADACLECKPDDQEKAKPPAPTEGEASRTATTGLCETNTSEVKSADAGQAATEEPADANVTTSSEQRSTDTFEPTASQSSRKISAYAMTTVARDIPSLEACRALAAKLKFSPTELLQINAFDRMTAHHIMDKWYGREAENATGRVLYDALCAIGLKAIADENKGLLLESDKSPAPSSEEEASHTTRGLHEKHSSGVQSVNAGQAMEKEPAHVTGVPSLPENFCGRDVIVETVLKKVHAKKSDRVIALVGPPGFGKTSIAVAVSNRLQEEGKLRLIFVPLRGVNDIDEVDRKIADAVSPPTNGRTINCPLTDLLKGIQKRCLIVLDNAEDCLDTSIANGQSALSAFKSKIKKMLDCNDRLKILITSRVKIQTVDISVSEIKVTCLSEENAIGLLQRLCKGISPEHATEIVHWCGFVPLAVQIAACLMRFDGLSATELVDDFRQSGLNAIEKEGDWLDPEHQLLLMITAAVKHLTNDLQRAFYGFSFFPGPFSVEAAAAVLDIRNTIRLKKVACSDLCRRCLLEYDMTSERYSMQPLLSQFGRENCPPDDRKGFHRRFSLYFLQRFQNIIQQDNLGERLFQLFHLSISTLEFKSILLALQFSDNLNQGELRALTPIADAICMCFPSKQTLQFVQLCRAVAEDEGNVKCQNDCLVAELEFLLAAFDLDRVASVVEAIQRNKDKMDMSSLEDLNTLLFAGIMDHATRLASNRWNEPDSGCSCSLHKVAHHISTHVDPANGIVEKTMCFLSSIALRKSSQRCDLLPAADSLLRESMQWGIKQLNCSLSPSSSSSSSSTSSSSSSSSFPPEFTPKLFSNPCQAIVVYLKAMLNVWLLSFLSVPFNSGPEYPATSCLLEMKKLFVEVSKLCTASARFRNPHHHSVTSLQFGCAHQSVPTSVQLTMEETWFRHTRLAHSLNSQHMTICGYKFSVAWNATLHSLSPDIKRYLGEAISRLSDRELRFVTMMSEACGVKTDILCEMIEDVQPSSGAFNWKHQSFPISSVPFFGTDIMDFAILQMASTNASRVRVSDDDLCMMFQLFPVAKCCASCLATDKEKALHTCMSCRVVKYCSRLCQRNHYKQHKKLCVQLNALCRDERMDLDSINYVDLTMFEQQKQ